MDLVSTILMLTSVSFVYAVTLECPANIANGQFLRQFGSHCYEFILNHHGDWSYADTDCRSKGGYLLDIHSKTEQAFIYNTLQILGLHGDKGIWIGLTDKDKEGTWKWTSGTNYNFENWAVGQPGLFGGNEDCALLERNGYWGDYPCHGVLFLKQNHGWVCKYAAVPLTTKVMSTTSQTTQTSTNRMFTSSTLMSTLMSSTSMKAMTSPTISSTISSSTMKEMTSSTNTGTIMSSTPMSTKQSTTPMETKMMSSFPPSIQSSTMDSSTSSTPMSVTSMMQTTPKVNMMSSTVTNMMSSTASNEMSSTVTNVMSSTKQTTPMSTLKVST